MGKIEFENKESLQQSQLPEKRKLTAGNVNEIKDSVNWIYDNLPTKISDLPNDSDFQNGTQLQTAINVALSSVFKVQGSVAIYSQLRITQFFN
jgi:hypothetical protein